MVLWSYPPCRAGPCYCHLSTLPSSHGYILHTQNKFSFFSFFYFRFIQLPASIKKKCLMASPDATSRCATARSPQCRKGWPTTSQGPTWRCGRRLATARTWPSPVPGRCWPSCASPLPWSVVSGDPRVLSCAGLIGQMNAGVGLIHSW